MAASNTYAVCPECDGRVRQTATERICEECGLVTGTNAIDRGPEWRSFDDESDRRRTGAPLTRSRHDRGLSTEIGYGTGSRVTGRKRRQLARMRREHNRARIASKAEGNRVYGFTEIKRIVADLSLPESVGEQACVLFESAQTAGLLQGRSIEGFASAAVYATCRTRSLARTTTEIAGVGRADENELRVAYDALNRDLGLPTGPIDPSQYLPRYATKLELGPAAERRARECVRSLLDRAIVGGRNPSGVAAACLYYVADDCDDCDPVTQADAADVAGVSPVTIRSTVDDLRRLYRST